MTSVQRRCFLLAWIQIPSPEMLSTLQSAMQEKYGQTPRNRFQLRLEIPDIFSFEQAAGAHRIVVPFFTPPSTEITQRDRTGEERLNTNLLAALALKALEKELGVETKSFIPESISYGDVFQFTITSPDLNGQLVLADTSREKLLNNHPELNSLREAKIQEAPLEGTEEGILLLLSISIPTKPAAQIELQFDAEH